MIDSYRQSFVAYLENTITVKEPKNLYEPISYILKLGGKRMRPILTLMSVDAFGVDYFEGMDAAMAVEVFHNFTLIHDDIMDAAPLRRGNITVHEKWDTNIGILSGDAMMIQAYQFFESYEPSVFKALIKVFNKAAIEVCEGQQLDVDFETRNDVSIDEYMKMIGLKTSVLVACALKMGAIIAKTSEENATKIYKFGLNLGIAFQLQDDYLDTFGNPKSFGKVVGGDIMENKKTYLYLKALSECSDADKKTLLDYYQQKLTDSDEKIKEVKTIFETNEIPKHIKLEIKKYTQKAFDSLDKVDIPSDKKGVLKKFGEGLMKRDV